MRTNVCIWIFYYVYRFVLLKQFAFKHKNVHFINNRIILHMPYLRILLIKDNFTWNHMYVC